MVSGGGSGAFPASSVNETMRYMRRTLVVTLLVTAMDVAFEPASAQEVGPVNRIIDRLQQDRPAIGTFTRSTNPDLDFVVIDTQYGEFDIGAVEQALARMQTGNGAPTAAPIVRIPYEARESPQTVVGQVLDAGVFGVMFPDIETKEQAATAISSMRFVQPAGAHGETPPGLREFVPGSAPEFWGLSDREYQSRADVWPLDQSGALIAMLQIESLTAVDHLDDILDVPGIGAIFLGPTDLAESIGETGPNAPRVEALVQRVLGVCLERNVPCGYPIVARTPEDADRETARRLHEGFKVLAVMTVAR